MPIPEREKSGQATQRMHAILTSQKIICQTINHDWGGRNERSN